jgi:hypothetical protein
MTNTANAYESHSAANENEKRESNKQQNTDENSEKE